MYAVRMNQQSAVFDIAFLFPFHRSVVANETSNQLPVIRAKRIGERERERERERGRERERERERENANQGSLPPRRKIEDVDTLFRDTFFFKYKDAILVKTRFIQIG